MDGLRRHRRAARVDARGAGATATWPTTARGSCSRTASCRAAMPGGTRTSRPRWAMGRLLAAPARAMVAGDVRANENIALTAAHTLFALEHNRIVDSLPFFLCAAAEVRHRAARGRRRAAVHHLRRVPALARGHARAVPRLRPERERDAVERVRRRRLPRAQHDPRRPRAARARGHVHARAAGGVPGAGDRGDRRRRPDRAGHPAEPRVRQPRPPRRASAWSRCSSASPPRRSTPTTR